LTCLSPPLSVFPCPAPTAPTYLVCDSHHTYLETALVTPPPYTLFLSSGRSGALDQEGEIPKLTPLLPLVGTEQDPFPQAPPSAPCRLPLVFFFDFAWSDLRTFFWALLVPTNLFQAAFPVFCLNLGSLHVLPSQCLPIAIVSFLVHDGGVPLLFRNPGPVSLRIAYVRPKSKASPGRLYVIFSFLRAGVWEFASLGARTSPWCHSLTLPSSPCGLPVPFFPGARDGEWAALNTACRFLPSFASSVLFHLR